MHEEMKELLAAFVLRELSESESSGVVEHLERCPQCRQEVQRLKKILACTDRLKDVQAGPKACATALRSVMEAVRRDHIREVAATAKRFRFALPRRRFAQFAAAAAVVFLVTLGISLTDKHSEVAWGSLAERLEKIQAYSYKTRMLLMDGDKMRGKRYAKIYYSSDYGVKVDIDHLIAKIIVAVSRGSMRVIFSDIQKYMELAMPPDQINLMKQEYDPVNLMKSMMALRYVSLGKSSMHGVDVEGIEVTDEPFQKELYDRCTARLWVSVQSGLPVQFEVRGMSGHVEIARTFGNFEWDTKLDENFFEADINNEYTLAAQISEFPMNEETAVQYLRSFAGINSGRYPLSLGRFNNENEFYEIFQRRTDDRRGTQSGLLYFEEEDFDWKEYGLLCAQMGAVSQFYGKLARDGRDAAYYGERVTPDMPNKPLLRWKVSDNQYRVIWGDLHITSIPAQELVDAERSLLQ